ncbi:MAG: type I methionyl aminopeptidase [Propionibacterium sp.]|nr:type I methionyl aminopeptidase [Propionibacterium sp.]
MIELKSAAQLRLMRRAGLVVAEGLEAMTAAVAPGITTGEIDQIGRDVIAAHGATSNFLNYGEEYGIGFPGVACISVNDELVHGIPGDRVLAVGDMVSIDYGAIVEGWHADAARTVIVGEGTAEERELNHVTEEALWAGILAMRPGGRVGDVSKSIEKRIRQGSGHYGILREFTGHGIGSAMHMPPDVPNIRTFGRQVPLRLGMALAIEPMVTLGTHKTAELDDGWTIVSKDGSKGSHWENTAVLTERGIWVLTEFDGGESRLGERFGPLGD